MTHYAILAIVLLAATPATAEMQSQPASPGTAESQPSVKSFDLAREKVEDCAGEKFVFSWGIGAHPTKVTLCSNKGASQEEVIRMLDEAATKIEGATSISEDRRTGLVDQIRAKIAQLKGTPVAASPTKPVEAPAASPAATADNPPVVANVPEPAASALIDSAPEAPAPAAAPPPAIAAPVAAQSPAPKAAIAAKPQLTFECIGDDFPGGGPCISLNRDTILSVKSGQPLASDVSLRFVRDGNARAEISLGSMNKGQAIRLQVPREVCSGVVSSDISIEVTRGGQVVDRLGPYLLRC